MQGFTHKIGWRQCSCCEAIGFKCCLMMKKLIRNLMCESARAKCGFS